MLFYAATRDYIQGLRKGGMFKLLVQPGLCNGSPKSTRVPAAF